MKSTEDRIPTAEEWFFAQNPTDDEKAAYFIAKQKAKEEEEARNTEFKFFEMITEQIANSKNTNRKVIDVLNSMGCCSSSISGDWRAINNND